MQTAITRKYFWDGTENWSDDFIIRRMLEYAVFPDLLTLPFDKVKDYLQRTDLNRLRCDEARKELFQKWLPYIVVADSWDAAVKRLVADYFVWLRTQWPAESPNPQPPAKN